ncbi:MAG TPA: hypothetical protein VK420_17845, partial [Longimicrobium sp.]|nr:hypothetical protein [Longimicrobium sp.]
MRRLSISILLATIIVVSTARADWQPLSVLTLNGVPNDVQIQGEGRFTVATNASDGGTGAYEIWSSYPGGGLSSTWINNSLAADPFISAYHNPTTCPSPNTLAAITQTGKIFCQGTNSQVGTVLTGGGSYRIAQLRHTPTGGNYLRGIDTSLTPAFPLFGYAPNWNARATQFVNNDIATALDVRRLGNVDYGFYAASNGASSTAFLSADGGRVHAQAFPVNVHPVRDVQVYGVGTGQVRGLVAGDGGMEIVEFQTGGAVTFAPVEGFSGATVSSVAFESGQGNQYGNGFGMAVAQLSDGGTRIFSAVPDPDRQAMTWVPTTIAPPSPGITPQRVRCDDTFCVLYQLISGASPLLYFNADGPRFPSETSVTIDEGAAPVPFTLDVTDPDGDAVFLTWDGG